MMYKSDFLIFKKRLQNIFEGTNCMLMLFIGFCILWCPNASAQPDSLFYKKREKADFHNRQAEEMFGSGSRKSLANAQKAVELSGQTGYTAGIIRGKINMGTYYFNTNDKENGYIQLMDAQRQTLDIGDSALMVLGFRHLGMFWLACDEARLAAGYLKKAELIAQHLKNEEERCKILNISAVADLMLGDPVSAYKKNIDALNSSKNHGFINSFHEALIVSAKIDLSQKSYKSAEKSLQEALRGVSASMDKRQTIRIYNNLGLCCIMLGDKRAKGYLDGALILGNELRLIKPLSETYQNLSVFFQNSGQPDSAYYSQKKFAEYSVALDKIENRSSIIQTDTSKMAELEDSERKLQKLQKENKIERLEIQKSELQLKLAAALSIIFPVLIIILFYRVNYRNQQNKLLVAQNEKVAARRDERQKTRQNLLKTEAELKQLNHTKDAFFDIVTRKLNEPLDGLNQNVNDFVRQLADAPKENLKGAVESMYQEVNNLSLLLENILQWSRVQMKRIDFAPDPFDWQLLIEDCLKINQDVYGYKNIKAALIPLEEGSAQSQIVADYKMMRYVATALISNAFKYSYPGMEIKIRLTAEANGLRFIVQDKGTGISEDDQKRMFRIDTNFCKNGTMGEKGTGLSLIISQEFAKMHGFELSFKSSAGAGAVFELAYLKNKTDDVHNLQLM